MSQSESHIQLFKGSFWPSVEEPGYRTGNEKCEKIVTNYTFLAHTFMSIPMAPNLYFFPSPNNSLENHKPCPSSSIFTEARLSASLPIILIIL